MYQTIDTDDASRPVIATGATRKESIIAALRYLDLPDGIESYEEWYGELESHANSYEALGLATETVRQ